jgi:probable F420-dependent oxidoreductase
MQHGLFTFPTDYSIDPASLARLAEDAGFDALFFPDHTHIPASRESPFPGGEPLGREYSHNLDLFVALTAAATVTTRLLIGSGICLLAQRDPIICAKEVASIDVLSGGRFIFGVGGGWNREEMANHGGDPDTRWALLQDRVEAMKAIWTQDEATYHGRFVDFDAIWSWPKPVQKPHPPILLGGNGPRVLDRVLAYADGWCPLPVTGLPARIAELGSRAEEAGREVSVMVQGLGSPPDPADLVMYAEAGVERCTYHFPSLGLDETERLIEATQSVISEVGAVG